MFLYEVRHAVRLLLRDRGFTAAAVLTLALGIGANVAVFALVEAVLLRPLPYAEAGQLAMVRHRDLRTGITKEFIPIGDFVDMAARQSTFAAIAAYGSGPAIVASADGGEPRRVDALYTGPGLFDVLRTAPALGRALDAADSRTGAAPVVVLGSGLWRTVFGSDPHVIGRAIKVDEELRQVVGVARDGFHFPPGAATDLIVPLPVPATAPAERLSTWIFAVARLAPQRSLGQATADLSKIARQLEREHLESNQATDYYGISLREALVGDTRKALLLLLAAVTVVMAIACANVANLMLARGLARRGEMAVRSALGAGRGRLVAQLLVESLVLALAAAVLSILAAQWVTHALLLVVPKSIAVFGLADAGLDRPAIAFAVGASMLVALVLAAVSSVMAGGSASPALASSRTSTSASARRIGTAIVTAEVALSIVLLFAVGLIGKSFARLLAVDPGFRVDHVTAVEVRVPEARYKKPEAARAFFDRAFAAVAAQPGVAQVGAAVVTPLTGNNWTVGFERADRPLPAGERPPDVGWQLASRGYFGALQIPLRSGRLFDVTDTPATRPVVIVSQAVERRFYAGERAVGHSVKVDGTAMEIVGVVGDIRRADLRDDPRADVYFPCEQRPATNISLFVRTTGDEGITRAALGSALRALEPDVMIQEPVRMADVRSDSVQVPRLLLTLLSGFAALALALASVGIYGVMSYVVRLRTREIGTRMALGATGKQIAWLVMRGGAVIAVVGTAIGAAAALAASRVLSSVLYATSAADPGAMAATTLVLVATILAACALPARRASRVDPARTLADQ